MQYGMYSLHALCSEGKGRCILLSCYNRKAEVEQEPQHRGHNGHYHPGYTFIPASVETYGYLGKPLVRYLNTLSEVAAARGSAVTEGEQ